MSEDGLLSQDDIDALTTGLLGGDQGGDDGGNNNDDSASGSGGAIDPEVIRPIIKMICDQGSSVISTVISKNTDIKIHSLQEDTETLLTNKVNDALYTKISFENDLKGELFIILTKKQVAMLADLMMMGDGSAEFEDDHKDALSELINQIMGSVNATISQDMEMNLSISQAETHEFSMSSSPFEFNNSIISEIDLKIDDMDDDNFFIIADEEFVSSYTGKQKKNDNNNQDELPPESSITPISGGESNEDFTQLGNDSGGGLFDSTGNRALDMLMDISLDLTIELGRTELSIRRILEMGPGAIVEMDRFAGEPVDLLINNKVVARGEVVVVDENFGIRVVSLVTPEERIKFLK
jgi:flagellar motor switch protein FliN/FliY